jgi:hypothetical protein
LRTIGLFFLFLISLNLADSVMDINGDRITLQLLTGSPVFDSLVGTMWKFIPSYNDSGLYVVKIQASDGLLQSVLTIMLHVANVNRPRTADSLNFSASRNATKAVTLTAHDPDGDSLTWSIVTAPIHGTLNGTLPSISYVPASNYAGPDSFTFKVTDNGLLQSNISKVRVVVSDVSVAPIVITDPANQTKNKGQSVSFSVKINSDINPAPSFTWYKENVSAPVSTDSIFAIGAVAYSQAGRYRVIVTNSAGIDTSNWATLAVNDVTPPVITLKGAADTSILVNTAWTDPGATASDDRLGDISNQLQKKDSVNILVVGKYSVTYSVSDGVNPAVSVKRTVRVDGWVCVDSTLTAKYFQMKGNSANELYIACLDSAGKSIIVNKRIGTSWVKVGGSVTPYSSQNLMEMSFGITPSGQPCVGLTSTDFASNYVYVNTLQNGVWLQKALDISNYQFVDLYCYSSNNIFVTLNGTVLNYDISNNTIDTLADSIGFFFNNGLFKSSHVMANSSNVNYLAYMIQGAKYVVKKQIGSNWIPAGSDSVISQYPFGAYGYVQMLSANNRLFFATSFDQTANKAQMFELVNSSWVPRGSADNASIASDARNVYSFELSSDGTPYMAYSSETGNKPIYLKKFTGSNWVGIPEPGNGLVIAEGIDYVDLKILGNIIYVAGLNSTNGKVYLYQYQKQ